MSEFLPARDRGPIFVVGSPRSGTSILTWCLGQHANILPLEESNWLGEFAVGVEVQYRVGCRRGDRSPLSASGIGRAEFFETIGDSINEMILRHRLQMEERSRSCTERHPEQAHPAFNIARSDSESKSRWVDGTPENSMYIAGLKKLFPDARFVHIVRDVESVVASMLNFKTDGDARLVKTEQEAYEYWMRTVQACVQAEAALGPDVMCRLRYDDLVQRPIQAMREVLEFLGEAFMPECSEPLKVKINSSHVPEDFHAGEPGTDKELVRHARQLSAQLQQQPAREPPSLQAVAEMEGAFDRRVTFMAELDGAYAFAQREVARLQGIIKGLLKGLNWCGVALAANLLVASLSNLWSIFIGQSIPETTNLSWFGLALVGAVMYVAIRKEGFLKLARKMGLAMRRRSVVSSNAA